MMSVFIPFCFPKYCQGRKEGMECYGFAPRIGIHSAMCLVGFWCSLYSNCYSISPGLVLTIYGIQQPQLWWLPRFWKSVMTWRSGVVALFCLTLMRVLILWGSGHHAKWIVDRLFSGERLWMLLKPVLGISGKNCGTERWRCLVWKGQFWTLWCVLWWNKVIL